MKRLIRHLSATRFGQRRPPWAFYQRAYEEQAKRLLDDSVIGGGDFALVGELELSALRLAGLSPTSTLLDLGCGVGRLAVHAVPYLTEGSYYGVEISRTILARARARVASLGLDERRVVWLLEADPRLPSMPDRAVDVACAFSVFTHLEHEDTFLYLETLKRVVRPRGRLVFSQLLLEENPEAPRPPREQSSAIRRAAWPRAERHGDAQSSERPRRAGRMVSRSLGSP